MPEILKQLFGSEKFMYVLILWQIPITVLAFMGKISVDAWRQDALWALGILIGGKTIQGSAASVAGALTKPTDSVTPSPVELPPPVVAPKKGKDK